MLPGERGPQGQDTSSVLRAGLPSPLAHEVLWLTSSRGGRGLTEASQ